MAWCCTEGVVAALGWRCTEGVVNRLALHGSGAELETVNK